MGSSQLAGSLLLFMELVQSHVFLHMGKHLNFGIFVYFSGHKAYEFNFFF
jgi:hypothetical protein